MLLVGCSTAKASPATTSVTSAKSGTNATTTAPAPVACATVTTPLVAGESTVKSGGNERHFLVALPTDFDARRPTRLIVNYHGSGSDMHQQAAYSALPTKGSARGYVVVTPDGTGTPKGWDMGGEEDYTFTEDLLAAVGRGMCIDPDRIDAAGISNGSAFSELAGCHKPYRFAAVGMVAATLSSTCPPDVHVPAVAFHGTADPVVPFVGGKVNADVKGMAATGVNAPGAEGAIAKLAQHNGCAPDPVNTSIGTDVTRRVWSGCTDGADVTFYRIEGAGHTWPGGIDISKLGFRGLGGVTTTIDATSIILDFFDAHPKPHR